MNTKIHFNQLQFLTVDIDRFIDEIKDKDCLWIVWIVKPYREEIQENSKRFILKSSASKNKENIWRIAWLEYTQKN